MTAAYQHQRAGKNLLQWVSGHLKASARVAAGRLFCAAGPNGAWQIPTHRYPFVTGEKSRWPRVKVSEHDLDTDLLAQTHRCDRRVPPGVQTSAVEKTWIILVKSGWLLPLCAVGPKVRAGLISKRWDVGQAQRASRIAIRVA